jgi:myo-inositol catabolism protein IolC
MLMQYVARSAVERFREIQAQKHPELVHWFECGQKSWPAVFVVACTEQERRRQLLKLAPEDKGDLSRWIEKLRRMVEGRKQRHGQRVRFAG